MRRDVPRLGSPHRSDRTLRDMLGNAQDLAKACISGRAPPRGEDETHFLDPLFAIAGGGRTPAEELLEDYRTRWGNSIDPVFTDYAY
jgi:glutamate--cysteine ligase